MQARAGRETSPRLVTLGVVSEGSVFCFYGSAQARKRAVRRNGGILMKSLALKLRRFLVSEDGPTAVEYAVMLSLIVIVCLTAISTIGTNATTVFNKIASSLH